MPSLAFEPQVVPRIEPGVAPVWLALGRRTRGRVRGPLPPRRPLRSCWPPSSVRRYRIDELVDLVTFATAIFQGERAADEERAALESAVDLVSSASVMVATPVYKGSYTGLLKSFLDVLRPQALAGAVAWCR